MTTVSGERPFSFILVGSSLRWAMDNIYYLWLSIKSIVCILILNVLVLHLFTIQWFLLVDLHLVGYLNIEVTGEEWYQWAMKSVWLWIKHAKNHLIIPRELNVASLVPLTNWTIFENYEWILKRLWFSWERPPLCPMWLQMFTVWNLHRICPSLPSKCKSGFHRKTRIFRLNWCVDTTAI